MGRSHKERLLFDLNEVREELTAEVRRVNPGEFDTAPREGMRTYRGMLHEIGVMEKLCTLWLATGALVPWEEAVAWSSGGVEETLADMAVVRAEMLAWLQNATEEQLQTPVPVPAEWRQYFSTPDYEPEEILRWVIRHEYYHFGQMVIYRWMAGDNPYKREGVTEPVAPA